MIEKKKINNKTKKVINAYNEHNSNIPSDTLGSYTGVDNKNEKPCQDADDL